MGDLVRPYLAELRDLHPDIPWHSMYNLRNRIMHDEGIDHFMMWDIIQQDLPVLIKKLTVELTNETEENE